MQLDVLGGFAWQAKKSKVKENVAAIVADMKSELMYVQMPLFPYIKMKWKRRKTRKNLRYLTRWAAKRLPAESKTSIYILMDFVREYYNVPLEIFKEINDAYYGWVE